MAETIGDEDKRGRWRRTRCRRQRPARRRGPEPGGGTEVTADPTPPPSRRTLADQLTSGSWTEALPGLAAADPEALRQLAKALPGLYR
ncbi:hypothetical protein BBK82_32685 [Lentzea guizhouensis]|uniref:Uncharacterized protein n=1 Tax=Lentzea guizhouensis TaxID=1586287 RepID=A0A1B2HQT5_9PSEU|nr:hypothetical protein [Lentzea guizhouensis]ANZ40089.1 hypothetical protein BBK82_32685 [Lentzea guizhouensis]